LKQAEEIDRLNVELAEEIDRLNVELKQARYIDEQRNINKLQYEKFISSKIQERNENIFIIPLDE
jgi:hypothetical protein